MQQSKLTFLAAFIVILIVIGMTGAYNPDGSGGTPSIMGHSVDELNLSPLYISGGYVLVPGRPAFSVSLSVHWTAQGVILFDEIGVNNGNHYSSATGRFTAPVGGLYQLCFGGIEYPMAGISYADIRVNGVRAVGGRTYSSGGILFDGSYKCVIADLNTGDYVNVYNVVSGQGWYQNPYALFSGHLL